MAQKHFWNSPFSSLVSLRAYWYHSFCSTNHRHYRGSVHFHLFSIKEWTLLHNSHTLGLLKNEARNLRHMSTAKVKVQRIMEWLTFLQLRNTSWLVPSYRSVSITHSFHFGIIFSSFGAKAFASLQQYPFQIYRCFIPKNIFFWDNSLSVRT